MRQGQLPVTPTVTGDTGRSRPWPSRLGLLSLLLGSALALFAWGRRSAQPARSLLPALIAATGALVLLLHGTELSAEGWIKSLSAFLHIQSLACA